MRSKRHNGHSKDNKNHEHNNNNFKHNENRNNVPIKKEEEKLDSEMEEFIRYCYANRITHAEIQRLFKPYTKMIEEGIKTKKFKTVMFTLAIIIVVYCLSYLDLFSWSFSAIGRLIMIQLLSVFDWTYLANEQCAIPVPFSPKLSQAPVTVDCMLCQGIEKIEVKDDITQEELYENFIVVHTPVIIGNAVQKWPNLANASELKVFLKTNPVVANSIPCEISTNIYSEICEAKKLVKRMDRFENYFLQFQNCETKAVKHFRLVSPRPPFLPAELAPIQYSWVFVSKNFFLNHNKNVEFGENVILFVQITGRNYIQLLPNKNCEYYCPLIDIELKAGEALVFTNLWSMEYRPDQNSENIAIALETH